MPLLKMAQESLARLTKIEAAREGVAEAQSLEGLLSELKLKAFPLKELAANAIVLRKEGVGLSSTAEIAAAIDTIKNVSTRFSEVPKSTTLKQGARWTGLTKKLVGLATQVADTQTKDWQSFFENNFFGGVRPELRRATLAPTPENEKMLKRYTELFQGFIKYRTQIPKDGNEYRILKGLSDQLAELKFQENVPDDVRTFFEATGTGASLELLTNEVIDWLRSNNLLGRYIVRARIN
jgi:hypothetical protein